MSEHAPKIIDVYWEGPKTFDESKSLQVEGHCLYQIYGTHPVYGPNSLLYIGKTEQAYISSRLKDHEWIDNQADDCKVYVATCGEFTSWKEWGDDGRERYQRYENAITVSNIESLLIYAHQPSYNSKSLKSNEFGHNPFRLFNSGRRASLLPEISTQFYIDPNPR